MDPRQVENRSDLANQVIVGNSLFKTKRVKQPTLVVIKPPHHRPPPRIALERRNHCSQKPSTLLQHGVIPGSCHTKTHEAISMWPCNDGEQLWNAMWDWTCR